MLHMSIYQLKKWSMNRFQMVSFEYSGSLYYSIIRSKTYNDYTEYYITIMNGQLENLLHGNHIIKEINGSLQLEISENKEQNIIKERIAKALGQLLGLPINKIFMNKELT